MFKKTLARMAIATALVTAVVIPTAAQAAPASAATAVESATCTGIYPGLDQTRSSGSPTCGFWWAVQSNEAYDGGYRGPWNGTMGVNSWMGVQRYLNNANGAGLVVDGQPGPATYRAIQRHINLRAAYTPEIRPVSVDGILGPNTYKGWSFVLMMEQRG